MSKKPAPFNNPFSGLKIAKPASDKTPATPAARPPDPPKRTRATAEEDDAALFLESVGAVEKVQRAPGRTGTEPVPERHAVQRGADDAESLVRLAELVATPGALEVHDDGELVEGSVPGLDPNVLRKLRGGEPAPQATLDLHGLTRDQAKPQVDRFIERARIEGRRCIRIVTGRGLNSPGAQPVLKEAVVDWLSAGRLARQILGFCTAPPKDGGPGALTVLLRR